MCTWPQTVLDILAGRPTRPTCILIILTFSVVTSPGPTIGIPFPALVAMCLVVLVTVPLVVGAAILLLAFVELEPSVLCILRAR